MASQVFHSFDEVTSIQDVLDNTIFLKNGHGTKCVLFDLEMPHIYAN